LILQTTTSYQALFFVITLIRSKPSNKTNQNNIQSPNTTNTPQWQFTTNYNNTTPSNSSDCQQDYLKHKYPAATISKNLPATVMSQNTKFTGMKDEKKNTAMSRSENSQRATGKSETNSKTPNMKTSQSSKRPVAVESPPSSEEDEDYGYVWLPADDDQDEEDIVEDQQEEEDNDEEELQGEVTTGIQSCFQS